MIGYYIEARDGDIGHVEDFLIDDESWAIRYMVVDTVNWWPGKKVIVSPQWIKRVSWAESKVYVDLPREQIRNAPEYDPSAIVNREYESRLYDYYGR
ncbi:MAG: PRC-barrel domain containing protein, partial [Acidobacteriota bacterium]|nr:PRC-barrel domain containing protein [Acidobacteriota bacterium]